MSTRNGTAISTWPSEPRKGLVVCTVFVSVVPVSDIEPVTLRCAVQPCRGLWSFRMWNYFFTNIVTVFSPLSCFGFVSSLNGEPEKGIAVEVCWCFINFVSIKRDFLFFCAIFCVLFSCINQAIGLESCESFQEETVSDDEGQYRLRGLQVSTVKMIELCFFFFFFNSL